jgi:hypothetical protein
MHTILLVGADDVLLTTRAAILSRTGSAVICSNAATALAIQAEQKCELVVLCHSLAPEVCSSLTESIRKCWPATRILLVVSNREWGFAEARAAVDGTSSPEPERLIGQTAELLRGAGRLDAGDVYVRGGVVRGGPYAH